MSSRLLTDRQRVRIPPHPVISLKEGMGEIPVSISPLVPRDPLPGSSSFLGRKRVENPSSSEVRAMWEEGRKRSASREMVSTQSLWIGMYGFTIDRNKFGAFFIVLAAMHTFFLGVFSPINSWSKMNSHKWLNGAIFLLVTTLLIRIAIRLARWADKKWN
jgi:hypothetical protein